MPIMLTEPPENRGLREMGIQTIAAQWFKNGYVGNIDPMERVLKHHIALAVFIDRTNGWKY